MNKQILIIEDDKSLGPIIGDYLGFEGYGVEIAECGEEALGLLDYEKPALVLLDYNLPGLNGLEVLKTLSKRRPGLPVIMMTGCGSEHVAVEAMKSGAADYLVKPFQLDALKLVIDSTLRLRRRGDQPAATTTPAAMGAMDNQMRRRSNDNRAFHDQNAAVAKAEGAPLPTLATAPARMPGASGAMLASIRIAQKLVDAHHESRGFDGPAILIRGAGVDGGSLLARVLHDGFHGGDGALTELRCKGLDAAALQKQMSPETCAAPAGSETPPGAASITRRTIVLEEIGDLSLKAQGALVHLLDSTRLRSMGSRTTGHQANPRVIATTNSDLEQRIRLGLFRADLYYRISTIQLHEPAIRDDQREARILDLDSPELKNCPTWIAFLDRMHIQAA